MLPWRENVGRILYVFPVIRAGKDVQNAFGESFTGPDAEGGAEKWIPAWQELGRGGTGLHGTDRVGMLPVTLEGSKVRILRPGIRISENT
jgi:hypothetical protein